MVMANPYITSPGRMGTSDNSYIGNLIDGAQFGFAAHPEYIDGGTPLIMPPVIPIMVRSPGMMASLPQMLQMLKAMVERMPINIDGVDFTPSLETTTIPASPNGQMLTMPTNMRVEQTSPVWEIPEMNGMCVFQTFFSWMNMIRDTGTNASTLSDIAAYLNATTIPPHVMSTFTMDVLMLQFDMTYHPDNLIDAYILSSMFPTSIGSAGYKRTYGENAPQTRSINFASVLIRDRNTKVIGQRIARVLNLHKQNSNFAAPITTDIESILQGMGYEAETAYMTKSWGPIGADAAAI